MSKVFFEVFEIKKDVATAYLLVSAILTVCEIVNYLKQEAYIVLGPEQVVRLCAGKPDDALLKFASLLTLPQS